MTTTAAARPAPFKRATAVFVATLVVGLVVGRFAFLQLDDTGAAAAAPTRPAGNLAAAQAALAANPDDPQALTRVGLASLTEARRTADPIYYARAADAIDRSLARRADAPDTLVAAGLLALARHDFAGALDLAGRARLLAPLAVDPLGVEVDALVELGRYDEAATAVDEMVRRRPDVASLSRASYVAELTGDRDEALAVMQQAVAAAGDTGSDAAYVAALLGDLHLARGNFDAASSAYDHARTADPNTSGAALGQARLLAARGDLQGANTVLQRLTDRLPLPDAVWLHGDVLSALGDEAGAAERYALVRAIEGLNASTGGIAVDLELARFETSRLGNPDGDPVLAVRLATDARAARPTIYGDDVLGWALHRAGRSADGLPHAVAATRLETGDPLLWWHRAAIEADLGRIDDARTHLARAFDLGGPLPLSERADADALARTLGVLAP